MNGIELIAAEVDRIQRDSRERQLLAALTDIAEFKA